MNQKMEEKVEKELQFWQRQISFKMWLHTPSMHTLSFK